MGKLPLPLLLPYPWMWILLKNVFLVKIVEFVPLKILKHCMNRTICTGLNRFKIVIYVKIHIFDPFKRFCGQITVMSF